MSEDAEAKSADQILDEIFSTLVTRAHSSHSDAELPAIISDIVQTPPQLSNYNLVLVSSILFLLKFYWNLADQKLMITPTCVSCAVIIYVSVLIKGSAKQLSFRTTQ